ncbi:phosphatase PAP2 family protein [Pollutibacter soli]|uniref:phosphatase PAP2 family protein n=1 Tax=Pollutibacter soli TaxID=3034157 RepID=UPI003013C616
MKRTILMLAVLTFGYTHVKAQTEPGAGNWVTWFIPSGKSYRLSPPENNKKEIDEVISIQKNLTADQRRDILYWNTGSPGFRWQELINGVWMENIPKTGPLPFMLLNVAIYDATIAAWDTKYSVKRPRPYQADKRIQRMILIGESPSYPCEHSVAAGVAVTILSHFYPQLKDSVSKLAQRAMASRIAAGVAFPEDTRKGFELGKTIAEAEIEYTKNYATTRVWDGKIPDKPGLWRGKNPMYPTGGYNKTVVLDSGSQFRPGPPPDFAKDMAELKNYKTNFRSQANAFLFGAGSPWDDLLNRKLMEYNYHLNPPLAAKIYATVAIGMHDGFISCWDAKYAYWGIRPSQYDTTYTPPLFFTPPFPGYPSGHAAIGAVMAEVYSYFFPADSAEFYKMAKDGAESRFQGGIHFRTDNEVALVLGKKVGEAVVENVKKNERNRR